MIDIAALRKRVEWCHPTIVMDVGEMRELLDEIERLRGDDEPSKEEFAVRIVTRRIAELEAALREIRRMADGAISAEAQETALNLICGIARAALEKKP